ncbi:MAG: phospholipase D family protein [Syntrophotaleaceae bacterium]
MFIRFGMVLCLSVMIAACATLPKDYLRTDSTAFSNYLATDLGQFFAEAEGEHPGKSGFALIRSGKHAFTSRIAMTELAQKSLDLQYYIWEPDATGRILMERLLRAADRGVRVRILLDDMNQSGRDAGIAALDAHPGIEIRLFNPFANRNARILDFLSDLRRINHRMHNKAIIADNAVAIVGGRNIGNHYFDVDTEANFRDLDLAAAGPVVRDVSAVFDYFWNANWSMPITALVDHTPSPADLQDVAERLRRKIADDVYPYPLDQNVARLKSELRAIRERFVWAPGRIVWNNPDEVANGAQGGIVRDIAAKFQQAQEEVLIESAYLVVLDRGVELAQEMIERGLRIRVLTNSLASNDVIAAHAGYAKRRVKLLKAGVEIYELRPDAGEIEQSLLPGRSKAALHTKAMVIDRQALYIGSFNLDPRSLSLNTEAAIYVDSPELARQTIAYLDEGIRPVNSYRVSLDEDGSPVWTTDNDGMPVLYDKEPETTFWQRFTAGFIEMLPVEEQL